jgi:4-aminobutyrate aminotransferase/(S)-3-amino-2-methylpropionate transaminase
MQKNLGSRDSLEDVRTEIPGPRTRELAKALARVESRNVTFVDRRFPIFWESAHGANVVDVDGNRYIDLTAGFGVANTGHSNPRVAQAISEQAHMLMHAMGDVHPSEGKVQLLERLAQLAPGDLGKTFLASTGAEAVEAAVKTAVLATGKYTFVSFRGSYHGLSLGALSVAGMDKFRTPFAELLPKNALFFDYPREVSELLTLEQALKERNDVAAVIIEPIQGRGGGRVAPAGYLDGLREVCSALGVLLVFDEIYTGFGRTGTMFACEYDGVVPDILCVGKALANGFPISAMIARPAVMDAWPPSTGEALHTSTFLGNPMACAAALANLDELQHRDLPARAASLGTALELRLSELRSIPFVSDGRGRGLMWGIEVDSGERAFRVVVEALKRGVILLQAGAAGDVLSITPPLVISDEQLARAVDILEECLRACG